MANNHQVLSSLIAIKRIILGLDYHYSLPARSTLSGCPSPACPAQGAFVRSGPHRKEPQMGFFHSTPRFVTDPRAGGLPSGGQHRRFLKRTLLLVWARPSPWVNSRGREGALLSPLTRALISCRGPHPHGLITSQQPPLTLGTGAPIWEFLRDTNI